MVQWWCFAQGTPWDWSWRAYPGVWLFVALVAFGYLRLRRSLPPEERGGDAARRFFLAGLVVLWLTLDWPVGALGAGYLASIHMVQFLLIAHVVAPLFLLGTPAAAFRRWSAAPAAGAALHVLTSPLVSLSLFAALVITTHLPAVVDTLMVSPAGSFLLDTAWLTAGIVFWWPVVAAAPERPGFGAPLKMLYLFGATVVATAPAAFLVYADLPVYATYELAPPIPGFPDRVDQQLAGLLMKVGGGMIVWTGISILFYRWQRSETRDEPVRVAPPPEPPALAGRR